jgi:hypothetical protein
MAFQLDEKAVILLTALDCLFSVLLNFARFEGVEQKAVKKSS